MHIPILPKNVLFTLMSFQTCLSYFCRAQKIQWLSMGSNDVDIVFRGLERCEVD